MDEPANVGLDVVMVYIREAHTSDGWPMGFEIEYPIPKSLQERTQRCQECLDAFPFPSRLRVLIDSMDNSFYDHFAAWPTGYFVLGSDLQLLYLGLPEKDKAFVDVRKVFDFIRSSHEQ
mmetsp:Transcript_21770/g.29949  ORF Transcript_21770/g.29949 Transcript_21770/m.29949 type:complete len:119 (-) Transcript_21770:100-456(-)